MTGNGIIWGRSRTSRYVHAYPGVKAKSFCGRSPAPDPQLVAGTWDEHDPETCRDCLRWVRWREKGLMEMTGP
jgi:hypothetical protein